MVEPAPDRLSQWLAALRATIDAAVDGADPLVVAGGIALLLLVLAWLALGARRNRQSTSAAEFAEIKGRLTAMSEMTARRQSEEAHALDERVEQVPRVSPPHSTA